MPKKASLTIRDVLRGIEERAPASCREEWDNVGLLAGRSKARVRSAVVSIDLTERAIELAIRRKANLIVNHHPCIFPRSRGLATVTDSSFSGPSLSSLICRAIENGISVVACHTNFDQCALEVVRTVAAGLGAVPKGRLLERAQGSLSKLVVFVPREHVDLVRNALCEAGAGSIGNYDCCTFGTEGIGTFRGSEGSHPFVGRPGRLERAQEVRLETVFPSGLQDQVIRAMLSAHPYEEVAYDVYLLRQPATGVGLVRGLGYGFWGEFKSPRPFAEVAKNVKDVFQLDGFWLTNPPPARVRKLAFVAGKGASFLDAASAAGCDLFITGETGYHAALEGTRKGMAVMELGHRQSERFFLTTMEGWLTELGVRAFSVNDMAQKIWK